MDAIVSEEISGERGIRRRLKDSSRFEIEDWRQSAAMAKKIKLGIRPADEEVAMI